MVKRYLAKNSRLFKSPVGFDSRTILIYGDEVDFLGVHKNKRIKVSSRKELGWLSKSELRTDPVLELYFIDVGQGDSTFIVTPARKKILVDGGSNDRAMRFLAWKYRLWEVNRDSPITIDLLVVSHADDDHIGGLIQLISNPKIKIKKIIHSGLAIFKQGKFQQKLGDLTTQNGEQYLITSHDTLNELDDRKLSKIFLTWKKAIIEKGHIDYHAVDSTSGRIDLGDSSICLEVLGPRVDRLSSDNGKIYRWFNNHAHTINGHCVVVKLSYNKVKTLLSGDLNIDGSKNLLQDKDISKALDANVLKAPHHGSHEFYRPWLEAVNPQVSIISSGDDRDYGHPRAVFLGAIGNASRQPALVFSTEIAGNFVEVGKKLQKVDLTTEERKHITDSALKKFKVLFTRRLHGMINVRTDGNVIYAARRVASAFLWEYYEIRNPSQRSLTRIKISSSEKILTS